MKLELKLKDGGMYTTLIRIEVIVKIDILR